MREGDVRCALKRDGETVFEGTEMECVLYIHRTHCYSFGYALTCEGYSLVRGIEDGYENA